RRVVTEKPHRRGVGGWTEESVLPDRGAAAPPHPALPRAVPSRPHAGARPTPAPHRRDQLPDPPDVLLDPPVRLRLGADRAAHAVVALGGARREHPGVAAPRLPGLLPQPRRQ